MFLSVENIDYKNIIGKSLTMSRIKDRTFELWNSFMPNRNQIKNSINTNFLSIQLYNAALDYHNYNLATNYTLWAGVEVTDISTIPPGFESLTIKGGLYAVFLHKGLPSNFKQTMDYIYLEWLPQSKYAIDHRPHFEVLGDKYQNNHPDSEEEVWVPIKLK